MSVSSSATEAVETIVDLLDGAPSGAWTNTTPDRVAKYQTHAEKARMNYPNPALYIWSPVDASLDAFDAEYSRIDETRTVEIQVWTLDDTETAQYHQDVIDFLAQYGNDNTDNTTFHRIRPTAADDLRSEHIVRQTDHYIATVTVELRNFRDT